MTQGYFENIKKVIKKELLHANKSILVASAWFTDNDLFDILCKKASEGLNIELIIADDEINHESSIRYELLEQKGGKFEFDRSTGCRNSLMHNKFCVIDLQTTITGSYNWSYQARYNRENITVSKDRELAIQFVKYFYKLKFGNYPSSTFVSEKETANLIFYIKNICKLIESKNYDSINEAVFFLQKLDYITGDIYVIAKLLDNKQWNQALCFIKIYLKANQQIDLYEDIELSSLSFHKSSLEEKFDTLIIEKDDVERKIHQLTIEYNQKLGDLLLELIELKSKYNINFSGAFNEEKRKVEEASETNLHNLPDEDIIELKKIYKKAALLCHPDKVDESKKEKAEKVFKALNTAYKNNDIEEVNRIYLNLSTNNFLCSEKVYDSKTILRNAIERLLFKIEEIRFEIHKLKLSPYYVVLEKVYDWDLYYRFEREKILNEITEIKNEFSKKTIFNKRKKANSDKY
jgi:hypothetical protein